MTTTLQGEQLVAIYIQAVIAELEKLVEMHDPALGEGIDTRFRVLCEEIERLDPREFLPSHRFDTVSTGAVADRIGVTPFMPSTNRM